MRGTIKEFAPKSPVDLYYILKHERWRLPLRQKYQSFVAGKNGIEIGGPSSVFNKMLPVYEFVGGLDGVNFSAETIWEGRIKPGGSFNYRDGRSGRQFVSEASDLSEIDSAQYDFLLSSNCLEHVANPIKALTEWTRVVKAGGGVVLVLPNKASTFDHRRPTTRFDHLLEDFERGIGEDDLTHLDEILTLHDLSMDPLAGDLENFKRRSLKNFENRTLHHHVFDAALIEEMLDHVGLDVVDMTTTRTDFFALAAKNADRGAASG
jgi:ubiquinone/menaquinone biosynthesis C-methylase UbiE